MEGLLGKLIVNFVLCLISFIAYSSQIFIIWPWYGSAVSLDLITLLLPFNLLVGMLLWNYFLCVFTDPGRVPDRWEPNVEEDGYEVNRNTFKPRFCKMCRQYKPPRAHHCRQCNRCILRMDHHCPWVNNCIGHHNFPYFLRFLFYVDVACSYHLVMVTKRVFDATNSNYWDAPSSFEFVMIILNYVACMPVLLAVGGFSLYHFYSLMNNTTTIEGWEKDKVATMVRNGTIKEVKFPYDLGRKRNISSVLGKNPWLWCWPTSPIGNGLSYELSDDGGHPAGEVIWPPEEPTQDTDMLDDDKSIDMPATPWTYGHETLNPGLMASNSQRVQELTNRTKRTKGTSNLPPYHPDYEGEADDDDLSDELRYSGSAPRVRRGPEGYEVETIDRNAMLHKYLQEIGEAPGRYHRYIPEPLSDESEEDEGENTRIGRSTKAKTKLS